MINNNFIFIKSTDFACTGMVTASCNLNKLCISIEDAYIFDIEPLLCTGFMTDVMAKWTEILNLPTGDPIPESLKKWYDLIFGSTYQNCNDKMNRHLGIKLMWVYYSYSNYIILNPFDDTPNGLKYKTNEWSSPVPIKDLNGLSISYKNKASEAYKSIKEFLCLNKDFFTTFDSCNCHLYCGCIGSCSCGKSKKVNTGFRYKSIKKK
jgi:hypothetical protein